MTQNLNELHRLSEGVERDCTQSLSGRLACLDALRGFDMFWIIGGDTLVHLMAGLTGWAVFTSFSNQLSHADWIGMNAYDLVFPLFMFLSGVSLSLSLTKQDVSNRQGRHKFIGKSGRRMLILIVLGVIYNFGWEFSADRFRLASVLGQIGIAYFFTAVLFVYLKRLSVRALVLVSFLLVTASLQLFVSVPGGAAGVLTPEGSINAWIDQTFLPGRLYGVSYDPEGILNCVSASAVTMFGALVGGLVNRTSPWESIKRLTLLGFPLIIAGYTLSISYPIIKSIWTVPFSLVAVGISALLLALFFWLFDVLKVMSSGLIFCVIGINSIGIYFAARFLSYPALAMATDNSDFSPVGSVIIVLGVIAVEWLVLYLCFKRGWVLKV